MQEQIDQINRSDISEEYNVVSVIRQIRVSKRTHQQKNKIPYSSCSPEVR